MTPLQAIKAHCKACSGGSIKEVKLCPVRDCALYPYRMGHKPPRAEKQA